MEGRGKSDKVNNLNCSRVMQRKIYTLNTETSNCDLQIQQIFGISAINLEYRSDTVLWVNREAPPNNEDGR